MCMVQALSDICALPKIDAKEPSAQGRQRAHPASGQYVPGGHASHARPSVCPASGDAVPAGQG